MENQNQQIDQIRIEKDKRPFYLWVLIILGNILAVIFSVANEVSDTRSVVYLLHHFPNDYLMAVSYFFVVTMSSLFISKINFTPRIIYIFLALTLALLFIPSGLLITTCDQGFWCFIVLAILVSLWGLAVIIFLAIYALRRLSVKVVFSLIWIEIVMLIGLTIYIGYNYLF